MRKSFRFGKHQLLRHSGLDDIHDALIAAFVALGVPADKVIGKDACSWNFGVETVNYRQSGRKASVVHVSTPDPMLSEVLARMEPSHIRRRGNDGRPGIDFGQMQPEMSVEPSPIVPGMNSLDALLISPLIIRPTGYVKNKRPILELVDVELGPAISSRLSKVAGRTVAIDIIPDEIYLFGRPHVCATVPLKIQGGTVRKVSGLMFPMTLLGSEDDLELAWTAGIGEKTRSGFGCIRAI